MALVEKSRFKATPQFRQKRQSRLVRVQLRDSANAVQDVMVRDISSSGLSAAASGTPPRKDEVVSIHLPDGTEYWGLVRWVEDNVFGVAFDTSATVQPSGMAQPTTSVAVRS